MIGCHQLLSHFIGSFHIDLATLMHRLLEILLRQCLRQLLLHRCQCNIWYAVLKGLLLLLLLVLLNEICHR